MNEELFLWMMLPLPSPSPFHDGLEFSRHRMNLLPTMCIQGVCVEGRTNLTSRSWQIVVASYVTVTDAGELQGVPSQNVFLTFKADISKKMNYKSNSRLFLATFFVKMFRLSSNTLYFQTLWRKSKFFAKLYSLLNFTLP